MERSLFLSAIEAALSLSPSSESARSGLDFAKRACTEWLARWPGDFRVRMLLANATLAAGEYDAAVQYLLQVTEADPESPDAYRSLSVIHTRFGRTAKAAEMEACLFGMEVSSLPVEKLPAWADTLQTAAKLLRTGRWQEARLAAESVQQAAPDYALPALIQLKSIWQSADYPAVLSAGKGYRSRWPGCAAFLLLMAQSDFSLGRNAEGVELLHATAVADPASEVADRYLGSLNPYKTLWPAKREAEISVPVPSSVAFAAGWNRLSAAPPVPAPPNLSNDIPVLRFPDFDARSAADSPMLKSETIAPIPGERFGGPSARSMEITQEAEPAAAPEPAPAVEKPKNKSHRKAEPTLEDLRDQLNRVADRLHMRKGFAHEDNRHPAYILLTSRKRLAAIYGSAPMAEMEKAFQDLLRIKRGLKNWSAYLVDVDNPESLQPFQLTPADPTNAWQVKTLVGNLDKALGQKGEMIGALLLVGGHEVIPLHLLPNPADDDDREVASDNPYATRDENYYVPEWPVGRIPSPADGSGAFLLKMLSRAGEGPAPTRSSILANLVSLITLIFRPNAVRFRIASGITASVWRKASVEAFRVVGSSGALLVCPPTTSTTLPSEALAGPKYSYFNLHGMENGPEWLGQRDPNVQNSQGQDFPVALVPLQIASADAAPTVVFTEACYGANILNKNVKDANALEFLATGTRAFVGSTKIGYGASSAPLIAADLLGQLFLQNTKQGFPAGEALRKAKLAFASEMNRRQGFLDPEDQKTIISFVLFGDPLFIAEPSSVNDAKRIITRWRVPPEPVNLLTGKSDLMENGSVPSENVQIALKKTMKKYLPGMDDGRMRYLHPREAMVDPAAATAARRVRKPATASRNPAWVVALDRKYQAHGQEFTQYAKISLDAKGRVVKMVVSR